MYIDAVEALHKRLREYIEAVFHISDSGLLKRRRDLLEQLGVIRQPAFLESTKTYTKGPRFSEILAGLHPALTELSEELSRESKAEGWPRVLFDPPHSHQADAIRTVLREEKDIVVFTGTGSGKTECFTTPVLLRLLQEAAQSPSSFSERATRAIVLYPMNALVNDQLGRIRRLLGDERVTRRFIQLAGRPATFAQYTGRTPFPGVRNFKADGDGQKMRAFEAFYMDTVWHPAHDASDEQRQADATRLMSALAEKGRWPKKPDLGKWFGADRQNWATRLHPGADDPEMVARHEVYGYVTPDGGGGSVVGAPPDVLITNYSMLEYMLMRPIERPIFDRTREWLTGGSDRSLLLVLDEAHLYRGAQGTEVALLVRRVRERLGLIGAGADTKLRVAITSASFSAGEKACEFAADLVGRSPRGFVPIGGTLQIASDAEKPLDANEAAPIVDALLTVSLPDLYGSLADDTRASLLCLFERLEHTPREELTDPASVQRELHHALVDHPLRKRLVALTQTEARQSAELAESLFPGVAMPQAVKAVDALIALCALARSSEGTATLLPSRIHSFHRGLPGLWICVNPNCDPARASAEPQTAGKLFAQPRDVCDACGCRVFELFTCRDCGAAYARAACEKSEIARPKFLWRAPTQQPGAPSFDPGVRAVDLLLGATAAAGGPDIEVVDLDPRTGAIVKPGSSHAVKVGLFAMAPKEKKIIEAIESSGRLFYRCGNCGNDKNRKNEKGQDIPRSPVEDHQTKGQDPFYALVREQLVRQPPRIKLPPFLKQETAFRGRKVLVFSDGRQKAARLAAEIGRTSLRDCIRPLLLRGVDQLAALGIEPTLRRAYTALLVGALSGDTQLRSANDDLDKQLGADLREARKRLDKGTSVSLRHLENTSWRIERPIATALLQVLFDRHTGLQALALAEFVPSEAATEEFEGNPLPQLPGIQDTAALTSVWLGLHLDRSGCDLFTPEQLEFSSGWMAGKHHTGSHQSCQKAFKSAPGLLAAFTRDWLPVARAVLAASAETRAGEFLPSSEKILIKRCADAELGRWGRCSRCSAVQPAVIPGVFCVRCGAGTVVALADQAARDLFESRKGLYRRPALEGDALSATPVVAREHTAQLSGVAGEAQNRAERHELAFQDITAETVDGMRAPVDVLSCTTTMEVGIDIGDLSAVALRNMPPGRANYQQRAGRAGRRATGVATVVAYADQDGHNQASYEQPRRLIKAAVPDPLLDLSNPRIARRHVNAFVLQRYIASAVPHSYRPAAEHANLFASLGTAADFRNPESTINLSKLEAWLSVPEVRAEITAALEQWLPNVRNREGLILTFDSIVGAIRDAIAETKAVSDADEEEDVEDADPTESNGGPSLLDRLLYKGVLPRYAFPTDLASFHVFESTRGLATAKEGKNKVRYAPQRGLPIALSEYAPGRTVFVDGRLWMSSALYAPVASELARIFDPPLLRYSRICATCGYCDLYSGPQEGAGATCPSCSSTEYGTGDASPWIRPPGFAHAGTVLPRTEPDPDKYSRAGKAVLHTKSPSDWEALAGYQGLSTAMLDETNEIIVTNEGPKEEGFRVCKTCGAAEPFVNARIGTTQDNKHAEPRPNAQGTYPTCAAPNFGVFRLGTTFLAEVLLLRFAVPNRQMLSPVGVGSRAYQIAARSLSEALSVAACQVLEIEAGEIVTGYRPGLHAQTPLGSAVEIFMYDQLSGGAGYVREARDRISAVLDGTRALLQHRPIMGREPPPACDRACYGCLLSFKSGFEHALFDRHVALDLLEAAASGKPARVDAARTQAAYATIAAWCETMFPGTALLRDHVLEGGPDGPIKVPLALKTLGGDLVVPALSHPFSPSRPDDDGIAGLCDYSAGTGTTVVTVDHLDITRNLPAAMECVRQAVGG
jgi:ATP-dependent helicase YprA (DUF1998 family)